MRSKHPTILLVFVLLITLTLRFYFYYTAPILFNEGDKIKITTRVLSEPVIFEKSQYLKVSGLKVYLPLYPRITYGDRIVLVGTVRGDVLDSPELTEIIRTENVLFKVRNRLILTFEKYLPTPHSSLVTGMVLGSKAGISNEFWEILKNSGTAHVVVASGMNISLIAGFLLTFFVIFWKRKLAIIATMVGIWAYALLSGFDAPIIRASIMGSIAFIAQEFGRGSTAIRALILSGAVMLLINPGWAIDVGFLLSFFATLSLIVFGKKIKELILKVRPLKGEYPLSKAIVGDLSTSTAAQIGVFPILYYYFGQANVISPLINALLLWTVAPITILGMVGGIISLIYEPLVVPFLYLSYVMTSWFLFIVNLFG